MDYLSLCLVYIIRKNDILSSQRFETFQQVKDKHFGKVEDTPPEEPFLSAVCYFKDNRYWLYHNHSIDSYEEEKMNPCDKLWLVLKHIVNDKDYECTPNHGFKIGVGDIIKFGRVRYKVIVTNNDKDGVKQYDIMNRFSNGKTATQLKKIAKRNKV